MATWPQIRAGIFAGESGGDYDALFGFSNRAGGPFSGSRITDMTVDQAIAFSDPSSPYGQWVKGKIGRVATPMGAYQVVGSTLRGAKNGMGLTGNERMDAATQDKIGQYILATQGTGAWEGYKGPGDPNKYGTPSPYAGMPDGPKGQEAYAPPSVAPDPTMVASTGGQGGSGDPITSDMAAYAMDGDKNIWERLSGIGKALDDSIPQAPGAGGSYGGQGGNMLAQVMNQPNLGDTLLQRRLAFLKRA
jgi:hypothetical protein